MSRRERIVEFDILRSMSILLLFFHHSNAYELGLLGHPLAPLRPFVGTFVLGAFVFVAGYLSIRAQEDLRGFLRSRISRVYLPYVVALLSFIVILGVRLSARELVIHLLGLQMVLAPRLSHPIDTLWFVGMILPFYVLFGIAARYVKHVLYLVLCLVLCTAALVLVRTRLGLVEDRIFYYLGVYAVGLILAKTGRLQALTSPRWFPIKAAVWVLGIGLLTMYSDHYRTILSPGLVLSIAVFVLASILLVLSVARLPTIRNLCPGLRRSISYAAYVSYLLHRPIWRIVYLVYTPRTPTGTFLFTLTIGAPLVLFVSYALQKGYDLLTSNWRI